MWYDGMMLLLEASGRGFETRGKQRFFLWCRQDDGGGQCWRGLLVCKSIPHPFGLPLKSLSHKRLVISGQ